MKMYRWTVQWLANYGQGHQQSTEVMAGSREEAITKGEQIAKRYRGQLVEVIQETDDNE